MGLPFTWVGTVASVKTEQVQFTPTFSKMVTTVTLAVRTRNAKTDEVRANDVPIDLDSDRLLGDPAKFQGTTVLIRGVVIGNRGKKNPDVIYLKARGETIEPYVQDGAQPQATAPAAAPWDTPAAAPATNPAYAGPAAADPPSVAPPPSAGWRGEHDPPPPESPVTGEDDDIPF